MARTRSEIRDGAAFDFVEQCVNFDGSGDADEGGAGGAGIESGEERFERFRFDISAREIGGELLQIVLAVAAQERIDLLFEVADGERVGRRFRCFG